MKGSTAMAPVSRGVRFLGAGVAGFVIQVAVLATLTSAGLDAAVATAVAVEAAILTNFLGHERWTWRDRTVADDRILMRL